MTGYVMAHSNCYGCGRVFASLSKFPLSGLTATERKDAMTKTRDYPMWTRVNASLIVSEEQRDGTPDFYIARDKKTKRWCVKWRTSAQWSGEDHATTAAAMRAVEFEVDR